MTCTAHEVAASGTVLAIAPGRVQLAVSRQSACKACAEKSGCSNAQEQTSAQRIWLAHTQPLTLGDSVQVSLPEATLLRAAFLTYGPPLAGFMTGLLAGAIFGELAAMGCAATGLALGFAISAWSSRRWISPLRLHTVLPPNHQPSGVPRHD